MSLDLYLGIDPGVKNCALVTFSPTRNVVSTWKPKGEIPGGVKRLCYLMHHIKGYIDALQKEGTIRHIAMEGYSMSERFGQHNSGEVGAAIKLALVGWYGLDDPVAYPTIVAANQLKKFTTGVGTAKKSMMAKEVLKRWGTDFDDENLADAYALARVAYGLHARPAMTVAQQQVLKALEGRSEWEPSWTHDGQIAPSSSSKLRRTLTQALQQEASLKLSKRVKKSDSEPLVRRRLTRPSKQSPSASSSLLQKG